MLSWPLVFSFDLWVLKDRSSFLNLDYLIGQHLALGVDTFYSYGLLPVLLQHLLFQIFGRGYGPMIGCTVVTVVLMAWFWALLLRRLPPQSLWVAAVVAMSPAIVLVNPNFPYSLVILSMLFALACVLERNLALALAVSVVGCFSVPSLPLALTALLAAAILVEWWLGGHRSLAALVRQFVPGISVAALLLLTLTLFFGWKSVLVTTLPILGLKFYKADGMGSFSALLSYLHPPGYSLKYYAAYYAASSVTWFAACTVGLIILGMVALRKMWQARSLLHLPLFVVLCALLQVVFVCFAYGNRGQHGIYDPLLAAGMFAGISLLTPSPRRTAVLVLFAGLAILGEADQAYKTWKAWRTTRSSPLTVHLYAAPGWTAEWSKILETSQNRKVMLLSYASGVHHYFPSIQQPSVWFLYPGQLFPIDKTRVLDAIHQADVVVEDLTSSSAAVDYDRDIQSLLKRMCTTGNTHNFRIWTKPAAGVCPA